MFDNIVSLHFTTGPTSESETMASATMSSEGEEMKYCTEIAVKDHVEDWMTGVLN